MYDPKLASKVLFFCSLLEGFMGQIPKQADSSINDQLG